MILVKNGKSRCEECLKKSKLDSLILVKAFFYNSKNPEREERFLCAPCASPYQKSKQIKKGI